MLAYRSMAAAAAVFHMRHLELAPEGWRACVERVAQGVADTAGEKTFCLLCGRELQGNAGHDIGCLTMIARRILANEPLLLEQYKAQVALQSVAIDTTAIATGAAPTENCPVIGAGCWDRSTQTQTEQERCCKDVTVEISEHSEQIPNLRIL